MYLRRLRLLQMHDYLFCLQLNFYLKQEDVYVHTFACPLNLQRIKQHSFKIIVGATSAFVTFMWTIPIWLQSWQIFMKWIICGKPKSKTFYSFVGYHKYIKHWVYNYNADNNNDIVIIVCIVGSEYYLLGIVASTLHSLFHFIFTVTLYDSLCYPPQLPHEKTLGCEILAGPKVMLLVVAEGLSQGTFSPKPRSWPWWWWATSLSRHLYSTCNVQYLTSKIVFSFKVRHKYNHCLRFPER